MALNEQEAQCLVDMSKKIEWPLLKEVFHALVSVVVTVPLELCVLDSQMRALMFYRKDSEYNGYHLPGTVLRNDDTILKALSRLIQNELAGYKITQPENIGWIEVLMGDREGQDPGRHQISLIFIARLDESALVKSGVFFHLDALPSDILTHHRMILEKVKEYLTDGKPLLGV